MPPAIGRRTSARGHISGWNRVESVCGANRRRRPAGLPPLISVDGSGAGHADIAGRNGFPFLAALQVHRIRHDSLSSWLDVDRSLGRRYITQISPGPRFVSFVSPFDGTLRIRPKWAYSWRWVPARTSGADPGDRTAPSGRARRTMDGADADVASRSAVEGSNERVGGCECEGHPS